MNLKSQQVFFSLDLFSLIKAKQSKGIDPFQKSDSNSLNQFKKNQNHQFKKKSKRMEKSTVGENKNKQRRQRIEINGGFAGILLLGGVAFTAAALVAATNFAKSNSNKRSKSIHQNKKEESTDTTTNKIQKFEKGRNELGLLSLLHQIPSSTAEESSSQLCSNSSSSVIGFGATTRTKIVMPSSKDEIDIAKSFLPYEEEKHGNLLTDNSSSMDQVSVGNSFGGRSLDTTMGLIVDQENEYKKDNDNDDDEFENDEDESIEEKGEEDSEGTGDSSGDSNAEAIWPQELMEGDDNQLELKEMKVQNLVPEANKAIEELVREDDKEKFSLRIHQQNERRTGLTMVHHLIESKPRLWLWLTLAIGLLLVVIHSLLHNILSSTL